MSSIYPIVVLRVEEPPYGRPHAQHAEVVSRDHLRLHPLGPVIDRYGGRDLAPAEHLREWLGLLLQILVQRIRMHAYPHVASVVRPALIKHYQSIGVTHR